jgi:hypothetical protein
MLYVPNASGTSKLRVGRRAEAPPYHGYLCDLISW